MKKIFLLLLTFSVALFACKKETQLEEDLDDIKSFLKARNINAEKSDNIYYEIVSEGKGEQCEAGDTVAFKFKLYTLNKPDSLISSSTDKALTYLLPSIIPNVTETSDVYTAGCFKVLRSLVLRFRQHKSRRRRIRKPYLRGGTLRN